MGGQEVVKMVVQQYGLRLTSETCDQNFLFQKWNVNNYLIFIHLIIRKQFKNNSGKNKEKLLMHSTVQHLPCLSSWIRSCTEYFSLCLFSRSMFYWCILMAFGDGLAWRHFHAAVTFNFDPIYLFKIYFIFIMLCMYLHMHAYALTCV